MNLLTVPYLKFTQKYTTLFISIDKDYIRTHSSCSHIPTNTYETEFKEQEELR